MIIHPQRGMGRELPQAQVVLPENTIVETLHEAYGEKMKTKSEQILETVRELREARALASNGEWFYGDINSIESWYRVCTIERELFSTKTFSNHNSPHAIQKMHNCEFVSLAANKMDQLCEALEVCVEGLKKYEQLDADFVKKYNSHRYPGQDIAFSFAEHALTKAAEILGRDRG